MHALHVEEEQYTIYIISYKLVPIIIITYNVQILKKVVENTFSGAH